MKTKFSTREAQNIKHQGRECERKNRQKLLVGVRYSASALHICLVVKMHEQAILVCLFEDDDEQLKSLWPIYRYLAV